MSSSLGIVRSSPIFDPNVLQDLISGQDEYDPESDPFLGHHLALLRSSENISHDTFDLEEIRTTPLFSMSVKHQITKQVPGQVDPFPQYGLLAGRIDFSSEQASGLAKRNGESVCRAVQDPRIFLNVGAPWSVFLQLSPQDTVKNGHTLQLLHRRWNHLCERVKECVIADRNLGLRIRELAQVSLI